MIAESLSGTEAPWSEQAGTSPGDVRVASPRATVQAAWEMTSLGKRLSTLRRARHLLARHAEDLAATVSPSLARTPADTLVAEVLPLLDACRFLERQAQRLLAPHRLGSGGRPFWLTGVSSEVHRVPFGHILVIAPFNYPLLLPGVQTLQALAAGNSVTWKPGRGGKQIALALAQILFEAGLPQQLLTITDDTVAAANIALEELPAKVIFTGSAATGRLLLRRLAETATPSVMELSGCDAVLVLPSADLERTARALAFGMRLNGSATCMAPRRVLLVGLSHKQRDSFVARLSRLLEEVSAIALPAVVHQQLTDLLGDARARGAEILSEPGTGLVKPVLVLNGDPHMAVAQADLFAPVLTLIEVSDVDQALAVHAASPLTLTASIFGEESQACPIADRLHAATVLINDLVVPTADPRLPFGGRGASGFGVTRGAEGLLEMTQAKVIASRRNRSTRHYDATDTRHVNLFAGLVAFSHGGRLSDRWAGLRRTLQAAKHLRP